MRIFLWGFQFHKSLENWLVTVICNFCMVAAGAQRVGPITHD